MKITQGSLLDLQNLNLGGAEGVCAECELFGVHSVVGGKVYTDNITIVCPPDDEIEETDPDVFRFTNPESVRFWKW